MQNCVLPSFFLNQSHRNSPWAGRSFKYAIFEHILYLCLPLFLLIDWKKASFLFDWLVQFGLCHVWLMRLCSVWTLPSSAIASVWLPSFPGQKRDIFVSWQSASSSSCILTSLIMPPSPLKYSNGLALIGLSIYKLCQVDFWIIRASWTNSTDSISEMLCASSWVLRLPSCSGLSLSSMVFSCLPILNRWVQITAAWFWHLGSHCCQ